MAYINRPKNPTTIVVEKTTLKNLKHLARKDQSYDELINDLIKMMEGDGPS